MFISKQLETIHEVFKKYIFLDRVVFIQFDNNLLYWSK